MMNSYHVEIYCTHTYFMEIMPSCTVKGRSLSGDFNVPSATQTNTLMVLLYDACVPYT